MTYAKMVENLLDIKPNEEFKIKKTFEILKAEEASIYGNCEYEKMIKLEMNTIKYRFDYGYEDLYFLADTRWEKCNKEIILRLLQGKYKIIKIIPTEKQNIFNNIAMQYARACGLNWLIQDKNGTIYACENKPKVTKDGFEIIGKSHKLYENIHIDAIESQQPYYIGLDE